MLSLVWLCAVTADGTDTGAGAGAVFLGNCRVGAHRSAIGRSFTKWNWFLWPFLWCCGHSFHLPHHHHDMRNLCFANRHRFRLFLQTTLTGHKTERSTNIIMNLKPQMCSCTWLPCCVCVPTCKHPFAINIYLFTIPGFPFSSTSSSSSSSANFSACAETKIIFHNFLSNFKRTHYFLVC